MFLGWKGLTGINVCKRVKRQNIDVYRLEEWGEVNWSRLWAQCI